MVKAKIKVFVSKKVIDSKKLERKNPDRPNIRVKRVEQNKSKKW